MFHSQRGAAPFAGISALAVAGVGLIGAGVTSFGAVNVSVREGHPDGANFSIVLPGVIVPLVMGLVPDRAFRGIPPEAEAQFPAILAAVDELGRLPDGELVRVESHDEQVSVRIRHGALVVDVEDGKDSIHVRVPLTLVKSVLARLDRVDRARLDPEARPPNPTSGSEQI